MKPEGRPDEQSMVRERSSSKEQDAEGVARAADGLTALEDFLQALFAIGYLKRTPAGTKPRVGIEVKPIPGGRARRSWQERSGHGSRPGRARRHEQGRGLSAYYPRSSVASPCLSGGSP